MVSIDYVLRDKLDTLNSTLKEILASLELRSGELLREEKKEIYEKKARKLYKESTITKHKVFVGYLFTDGTIQLNIPRAYELPYPTKPSTYYRGWFIVDENDFTRFRSVSPSNFIDEIVTKTGTPNIKEKYPDEWNVTGYITDDGRAVYYDQYL